jgi:hypothetical protein
MSDQSEITIVFESQPILENAFSVAWHPILVDLLLWIEMAVLNPLPVITSTFRPGDKGVHGTDPLRGLDLRSRGYDAQAVTDKINEHWCYDSERPRFKCAIFHNVGRGPHIHLQVHNETHIMKGGWGPCVTS